MKFYDRQNRVGVHKVKVTFQDESYKGHIVAQIGGNCKGFSVMDFDCYCWSGEAIEKLKENTCKLEYHFDDGEWLTMELTNEDGDTCEYELECEELGDYVVAVEILSFKPEIQKH